MLDTIIGFALTITRRPALTLEPDWASRHLGLGQGRLDLPAQIRRAERLSD